MDCSLPGCGQPALRQWQRLAQADETLDLRFRTQEDLDFDAVQKRAKHLLSIRELEQMREVSPPETHARYDRMIAREQAAHDQIVPEVLKPRTDEPTVVAVHACEGHDVDDEIASRLHEAVCMTKIPCACYSAR